MLYVPDDVDKFDLNSMYACKLSTQQSLNLKARFIAKRKLPIYLGGFIILFEATL